MSRLDFTYPVGWPSHVFAEIDGYADIDHDGIVEIYATDFADKDHISVPVSGSLEIEIKRYLEIQRGADVERAMSDAMDDRRSRDRAVAQRSAAE